MIQMTSMEIILEMTIWLNHKVEYQQAFPLLLFSTNFSNLLFIDDKTDFQEILE